MFVPLVPMLNPEADPVKSVPLTELGALGAPVIGLVAVPINQL